MSSPKAFDHSQPHWPVILGRRALKQGTSSARDAWHYLEKNMSAKVLKFTTCRIYFATNCSLWAALENRLNKSEGPAVHPQKLLCAWALRVEGFHVHQYLMCSNNVSMHYNAHKNLIVRQCKMPRHVKCPNAMR